MEKLFNIKRGQYIQIVGDDEDGAEVRVPPAHIAPPKPKDIIYFSHVDGMYSYCIDADGNLIHPAAWTVAIVIPDEEVDPNVKKTIESSQYYR